MFGKKKEETSRLLEVLKKYDKTMNPLEATHAFVKEFLNPQPDRYDMTYRYEHSLRVAHWGKKIAEREGWNSEPLVMACLLHDVGYPECKTIEDFHRHPAFSAVVAEKFLKQIKYDEALTEEICRAIAIHDRWNDVLDNATPFELSVRDADDLDRFDIMRLCMRGRSDIGERSAEELMDICNKRIKEVDDWMNRIAGTKTAQKLWEEEMQVQKRFYESLNRQMEGTFAV